MGKIKIDEIQDAIKSIQGSFWDYKYKDEGLENYYKNNYERLINNANSVINNNSIKSAILWSELLRSDFIVKFILDLQSQFQIKKEISGVAESIKIIKNTFENSYQYFAFFTIADLGTTDNLYEFWYKPYKAKEGATKEENSSWRIGKARVSGKYWVLSNCNLFKYSEIDIKLMRSIRDAESHENLIFLSDKVAILEGKKTKEISNEDIIKFAKFLKECVVVAYHFYMCLLIKERLWIYLMFYITYNEKYKESDAPFHLLQKDKSKEEKSKVNIESFVTPNFCAIIAICVSYALKELWDDLERETERLNLRFKDMGLEVNSALIAEFRGNAICDLYNTISLFNYKTKQLTLKMDLEYNEVTIKDIDKLDFESLIIDIRETFEKVLRMKKKDENLWLFISMILGVALTVALPIGRFSDNLKNMLTPIKNEPVVPKNE